MDAGDVGGGEGAFWNEYLSFFHHSFLVTAGGDAGIVKKKRRKRG